MQQKPFPTTLEMLSLSLSLYVCVYTNHILGGVKIYFLGIHVLSIINGIATIILVALQCLPCSLFIVAVGK